ncbi:MAG: ATP-binding protein [Armatimonadota bacterium]|nr:ATP-binding protein [bacterium]
MISTNRPGADVIELRVPCKPEYVRTIRRVIADFAESSDMPKATIEEIEIAASEAATNIVRHAYVDCSRMPRMHIRCARRKHGLLVEVTDRGRGFCAPADGVIPNADIDFDREGGYGIVLIKCLMDTVNYISKPDEGTKIKMTKSVHGIPAIGVHSTNHHI